MEYTTMRKFLILMALAILTVSATGCSRCRSLFRRGAPCGGTALAAPSMLGGAIPLSGPLRMQQAVPQGIVTTQPECCCEQSVPLCDPCQSGYMGSGYGGDDCGCQTNPGEYFGGYIEGTGAFPVTSGAVAPSSSGTFPQPRP